MIDASSVGETRYHNKRCGVASDNSLAACWLKGLTVATKTDLLIRSNGATHQRRHKSAGKLRNSSMSISYRSNGRNAVRDLSASSLSDLSMRKTFLSCNVWMNGSITSSGEAIIFGLRQHKSKSPALISLLSIKIFRIVFWPSSISSSTRVFLRSAVVDSGCNGGAR